MANQSYGDVRVASRVDQALRIVYVDLGQHCPSCQIERRCISGYGSLEYSIRKLIEVQTRRSTDMNEGIGVFRDVYIDTQFVYLGERQDRTALTVSSGSFGSSWRNQPGGFVNSNVTAARADQRPRIGESSRDYSIERGNDFRVSIHSLQGCDRGLSLTILGVGHVDILLRD